MKALVTGGAGFIGSNLVEALVDDYEVTVLDNLHTGSTDNLQSVQKEVKFIKGSCNDCLILDWSRRSYSIWESHPPHPCTGKIPFWWGRP